MRITIAVKVTIGRSSRGCSGFGACSVTIVVAPTNLMAYDPDLNTLDISLSQAELQKEQPDKLPYFEGKDSVTFEEAFTLPEDVQQALGSAHPLTIPAGTVPLVTTDKDYIIQRIALV